ncbi:hypothetical protein HDU87_002336 [Geranomyces variabilis]|uniref:Uncharacterized protein n=1 Tax=Geranomyces variabilis TaxID=109894 RepID=A0AAD5TAQ8_9FUNG|nr:hypothetical protein HDU87_002336 [Geranomyces variabilis]
MSDQRAVIHLRTNLVQLTDLYREHNPQHRDKDFAIRSPEEITWADYLAKVDKLSKDQRLKYESSFLASYFHDFYNCSYIRTAVLAALFAGAYAECPSRIRADIFCRISEYPTNSWVPWISHQFRKGLTPDDHHYADQHSTVRLSEFFQLSITFLIAPVLSAAPWTAPAPVGRPPAPPPNFDLTRYLVSRVFQDEIYNANIWTAIFKLKQTSNLSTQDRDALIEYFD